MTFFAANPKTLKVEVITDQPPTGLQSYCYNRDDVKQRDIKQMVFLLDMVLGGLDRLIFRLEPQTTKQLSVFLCIKNRQDINIGTINL